MGNGYVVEAVNLAVAVYSTAGTPLALASLNDFFNLAPPILRTATPLVYGPFTSDPRVYYDSTTGHWFLTMLEIDTNPATGDLLTHSGHFRCGESIERSYAGAWNIFSFDDRKMNAQNIQVARAWAIGRSSAPTPTASTSPPTNSRSSAMASMAPRFTRSQAWQERRS